MAPSHLTTILGVLLLLLELVTQTYVVLGFAVGAFLVAGVQYAAGGFSLGRDILLFALASLAAIVVMRRKFRTRHDQQIRDSDDINRY